MLGWGSGHCLPASRHRPFEDLAADTLTAKRRIDCTHHEGPGVIAVVGGAIPHTSKTDRPFVAQHHHGISGEIRGGVIFNLLELLPGGDKWHLVIDLSPPLKLIELGEIGFSYRTQFVAHKKDDKKR